MVLLSLVEEFGFKAVLNHGLDIYREDVFRTVRDAGVPLVYGPMDSFPYKVELKHESWRNAKAVLASGIKFCMMSDHPVLLQRNMLLHPQTLYALRAHKGEGDIQAHKGGG